MAAEISHPAGGSAAAQGCYGSNDNKKSPFDNFGSHFGPWQAVMLKRLNEEMKTFMPEIKRSACSPLNLETWYSSLLEVLDGKPFLNDNQMLNNWKTVEDCFVLDFDPSEPLTQLSKLSVISDDISVVGGRGRAAFRDYPHSRHLCVKLLFKTTPHESYCEMCYCYVCDSPASCGFWKPTRCHTSEHNGDWKSRRKLRNSK
ncbi:hypothetical protein ACFX11_035494 [Malus domestica]